MLTKRTNLLLDEETYKNLLLLAKEKKVSLGEIIRQAINRVYKRESDAEMEKRSKVVASIMNLWEKTKGKKTDYRALIEYGRRF
ncbi:ribbon-helix-helix protein, CopG family [Candidatus Gottesmanbacteria bacterium]|nr:ribbon-helix-helix protein, CopG family [Candidatus Gottesmanbacteria bacterium]